MYVIGDMWLASVLLLIAYSMHTSHCLECESNQNGQSISFFKTNGDLSITGKWYKVNCIIHL
jgi:hypothetical protein